MKCCGSGSGLRYLDEKTSNFLYEWKQSKYMLQGVEDKKHSLRESMRFLFIFLKSLPLFVPMATIIYQIKRDSKRCVMAEWPLPIKSWKEKNFLHMSIICCGFKFKTRTLLKKIDDIVMCGEESGLAFDPFKMEIWAVMMNVCAECTSTKIIFNDVFYLSFTAHGLRAF